MVGKFGGEKPEQNSKRIFLSQAKGLGFQRGGAINDKEAAIDWADYWKLTNELIKFTAAVAVKKTVEKEIRNILIEIEKEAGESFYEIRFNLGLHIYLED